MSRTDRVAGIVAILETAGWTPDGHTRSETVRIPTSRAPVFGGIGGELRTLGGRLRFRKGDRRATVGARTVCFYDATPGGPARMAHLKTSDVAEITSHAQ